MPALNKYKLTLLILFSLSLSLAALFVGPIEIPVSGFIHGFTDSQASVLFDIRIPRIILGYSIGAILALAGVLYQTVFSNPLADPFTLGVSSGASLGASIYTIMLAPLFLMFEGTALFALLGALSSIFFVLFLSQITNRRNTEDVLLCGIVVSFFCSSFILLLQYISDSSGVVIMSRWFMGGLGNADFQSALVSLLVAIIIISFAWRRSSELDLTLLGGEIAASHGVSTEQLQFRVLLIVSCIVGISVSVAGPIGFVGIMIPHICRKLFGSLHKPLIIGSALVGGVFLVSADAVARLVIQPAELPVGVVTSLLGGPFFVWVMISSKRFKEI